MGELAQFRIRATFSGLRLAPSCHGSRRRQAFYLKENKEHARTIFVILLVLWLLGLVTAYTFGGFVHLLLVVALVVLVIQLLQGRRVV